MKLNIYIACDDFDGERKAIRKEMQDRFDGYVRVRTGLHDIHEEAAFDIIERLYRDEVRWLTEVFEKDRLEIDPVPSELSFEERQEAEYTWRDDIDPYEELHEMVDSSQWVIYTHRAQVVIMCSNNDDAYEEELGMKPETESARAYMALKADILEEMHRRGTWPT